MSLLNESYDVIYKCLIEKATQTVIIGCKDAAIPEDKTVTRIGAYAFYECQELDRDIEIPNNIEYIDSCAFYGCKSIKSITIPEGVDYIGSYAFSGCSSLVSLTIPKKVKNIAAHAVAGCSKLANMNIPAGAIPLRQF